MDKKFASRAGEKLEFGINYFNVAIENLICADFGSSTGGFVDCLLKHNASKVYAVETGYGLLDWNLRNNPKVIVMERTNAMHVILPEKMDLITIDTSWTKQKNVLPNAKANLKASGLILTLVKPAYEIGDRFEENKESALKTSIEYEASLFKLRMINWVKSPITGAKGNDTEYLALFTN